jgi:hypothetical protein
MKQSVYIVFLLTIIYGCEFANNDKVISGHWYSCAKNGDYIEMHIKNNKYKYSTDFGIASKWNELIVKGDTLIQYDKFLFEDSIVTNKAKFELTDKGELKLEYLTSAESWTFFKIDEQIGNIEDNLVLRDKTIERSKERKCIDYRTREEINKDSLDGVIDFQF